MRTFNKSPDEHDEYLHPLWLGILILFSVIIILGILCCIRRKCGSQIGHLLKLFCCSHEFNNQHHPKLHKQSSVTNPYNWGPVYNPAPNLSPKLYTLVRSMQMNSFDPEVSTEKLNDTNDHLEGDALSLSVESEPVKTSIYRETPQPSQGSNKNRNCEAARKFYASMRQTSQCQMSTSLDSTNNDPPLAALNRLIRTNPRDKSKFFQTPRFFQSIGKSTY